MDFSLFYAKLLGFYFVIAAIAMLIHPQKWREFITEVTQNRNLVMLAGIGTLLFGLTIVLTHNDWTIGVPILVTLVGYVWVVRGIARLCFPDLVAEYGPRFAQKTTFFVLNILLLVVGVLFLLFGYMILVI